MVKIEKLGKNQDPIWDAFVQMSSKATLHHSVKYRNFLSGFLEGCEDFYLVARQDEDIVAALPMFVRDEEFGKVGNSLPFFGSHGGIIWKEYPSSDVLNKSEISNKFFDFIYQSHTLNSLTIVQSLFSEELLHIAECDSPLITHRIGQFTALNNLQLNTINANTLMNSLSPKKQWDIQKARKHNFRLTKEYSFGGFEKLYLIHQENMKFIGGKAKTLDIFSSLFLNFDGNNDYSLYLAWDGSEVIAGLCLLYFGTQVEYFVPAVLPKYRSSQVLNELIFRGMLDSLLDKKSQLWNWGGTWKSQEGVYRFKKSWGANEKSYFYQTWVSDFFVNNDIKQDEIVEKYPFFYCYPFE